MAEARRDFDEKHYANFLPCSYCSIAVHLFAIEKQAHSQIVFFLKIQAACN